MRMLRVGLRVSVQAASRPAAARVALGLAAPRSGYAARTVLAAGRGFATTPVARAPEAAKPEASAKAEGGKAPAKGDGEEAKPKLTLWQKVKKEMKHYWEGTKLLGYEIKVSTKLALKLASGRELSRREDRQLKRTTQDLVRVLPFSVFVIVPFAELLLPVALRLFPNMLPSVYETNSSKKQKIMKLGKTRSDVGTYLRDTIKRDSMKMPEFKSPEQQHEFEEFFKQVRDGEKPGKDRLLTVARMFKDDMLLDNLTRPQLAAIAKYINLQSFGTSIILRYQIRYRMRMIKQDDRVIDYEGVDSLNTLELQNACQSRGFKVYGVSTGRLRENLSNWLQLRLHDRVPSTLLILASAYNYSGDNNIETMYDGVLSVLSALPPEVYHEAELEVNSDSATNAQRLEVLKEQDELIRDENKEEQDSGHVVQVRDDLNVDDEERPPAPTESEADVKADQDWYKDADREPKSDESRKVDELVKEERELHQDAKLFKPTESEADVRADGAWSAAGGSHADAAHNATTESEGAAKADTEWAERHDAATKKPQDSHAQASHNATTESEGAAKADAEWAEHREAASKERLDSHVQASNSATTESEGAAKADSEWAQRK